MTYTYKVSFGLRGYFYSVYSEGKPMRARSKEYRTKAMAENAAKRAIKRLEAE